MEVAFATQPFLQLNCFFVAAILEEALTDPVRYVCSFKGVRAKWAIERNNAVRKAILADYESANEGSPALSML